MPVARLLAAQPKLTAARAAFDDGRFTVWMARRAEKEPPREDPPQAVAKVAESVAQVANSAESTPNSVHPSSAPTRKRPRRATSATRSIPSTRVVVAAGAPSEDCKASGHSSASACDKSMSKAQRKRARRKEQQQLGAKRPRV